MGLFGDDVEICPSGGDILLCPERDIELCTECTVLGLTLTAAGTELAVNDIFTASGGSGSLSFTFDSGTLSVNGNVATVATINSCGASGTDRTGTVTVTDSCTPTAQTASINVRLTGGHWVYTRDEYFASGSASDTDDYAYCRDHCCCSWEGMDLIQRVKYTDGTYGDAWFGDNIKRWRDGVFNTDNVTGCLSGHTDCSFCGGGTEAADARECLKGICGALSTVSELDDTSGKTVEKILYTESKYIAIYRAFTEWICP